MVSGTIELPVVTSPDGLSAEVVSVMRQMIADAVIGRGLPQGADPSSDSERVDLLTVLEQLKNTAAAAQAALAVDLDRSVRDQHEAAGLPRGQRGRGVAAMIGLARSESPNRANTLLGLARDLHSDLPHLAAALRSGRVSEFRATVVDRETGVLDSDDRRRVDTDLFGGDQLAETLTWGTRQLAAETRKRVYALDPSAVARAKERATSERRVSVRPAPSGMSYLTALLPLERAVAAYACLYRDAQHDPAAMADLLVERVTGQATADAVPVTVSLVVSDETLFNGGGDPGFVPGHGPVDAHTARAWASEHGDYLRRFYADPQGSLIAMTSVQRFLRGALAAFLQIRDQGTCRTPWCDAPAVTGDHVTSAADGGETSGANGQGYCLACNLAKEAPGWRQHVVPGQRHTVRTRTPTGHRYESSAPAPPTPHRRT
ncbi:MAG: DUF222 domain-containing protein [Nocardioides sp.]